LGYLKVVRDARFALKLRTATSRAEIQAKWLQNKEKNKEAEGTEHKI